MMKKIILAAIGSIAIVVGIVMMDNDQSTINQINQDLSSTPPAAGGIINDGDKRADSSLGSVASGTNGGLTRKPDNYGKTKSTYKVQKRSVYKVTEGNVTSYSDVPRRATLPSKTTNTEKKVEVIQVDTTSSILPNKIQSPVTCNIGVNSGGLEYYSTEMPLKDLAKMSMGWIRPWRSKLENIKLDLDVDGYLKTVDSGGAQTIISDDNWGRSKDDNKYVVLYDGEGKLGFNLSNTKIIKEDPGRIEIKLGKGRTGMVETSTNPANYLRNIRIVPLADESNYKQAITRDKFRQVWKGVKVIRYLDAQRINNSREVKWSDRAKTTTFGSKKGQSLEDIIQMSNETNTSPWLLIPHLANDDYIRKMAIYVRDNLNSHLKVYLEYTNEAWNAQFTQYHYLQQLASERGTSQPIEYGKKARNVFLIWTTIFGESSRLVRVIGAQKGNPWIAEEILKTPGLSKLVDALAVSTYIAIPQEKFPVISGMSDDAVFSYINNEILPMSEKRLIRHKQIADQYNLKLISYEGGQHFAPVGQWTEDQVLVDRLISLNRSPKMYKLYMDIYKQWTNIGGELLVWFRTSFRPSKWGSWGLLENTGQEPSTAPKYQAYRDILRQNACIFP